LYPFLIAVEMIAVEMIAVEMIAVEMIVAETATDRSNRVSGQKFVPKH